jgi:hypothetical protein
MSQTQKLTNQILLKGMSKSGGWSKEQLALFGESKIKGWKERILGQEFPAETIKEFIALRGKGKDDIRQIKITTSRAKAVKEINKPIDKDNLYNFDGVANIKQFVVQCFLKQDVDSITFLIYKLKRENQILKQELNFENIDFNYQQQ